MADELFRLRHRAGCSEAIIAPIIWSDNFSWLVDTVIFNDGGWLPGRFTLSYVPAIQRTKEQITHGMTAVCHSHDAISWAVSLVNEHPHVVPSTVIC